MKKQIAKNDQKKKRLNRSKGGDTLVFLMLVVFGAFMAMPLVYNVVSAFKPPEEIFVFPPRFYVVNPTSKNFKNLFQVVNSYMTPFNRYLFNSIFVSVVSTALSVFVGGMAAYPFAKKEFKGKNFIWSMIMMTLLFSGGVTDLPAYILKAKLGLLNTYWVLILPVVASPLQMFLLRQFMLQIPDSLLEAARLDGASDLQILINVVLPNVKPALQTVLVLAFTAVWNTTSVGVVFDEGLKLLPTALSQISAGGIARTGITAAATLLLLIPPIAIFAYTQSGMLQTMSHSGIKD